MMNDYLGWDYVYFFAMSLLIIWALILGLYLGKRKGKSKNVIYRKWWFWLITLSLLFHVMFVQFLNPSFFGLGTPDYFTKIKVYDDAIVLMDNDVTYFDDERTGTEDRTSHLRIHVVDRKTQQKRYSQLIGDNYSSIIDENGIFVVENSMYAYHDADNVVSQVSEFDLESKELTPIVTNQQLINVEGNEFKVFEIMVSSKIQVKSDQGDVYTYNPKLKIFDSKNEASIQTVNWSFFLNTSINNQDKKQLIINNKATDQEFLLGEIVNSFKNETEAYVLIKWYKSLDQKETKFSMINGEAEMMWSTSMTIFEKTVGETGFEDIHIFAVEQDLCYLTINEYLFEMNLFNGRINWWLKL